MELSSFKAVLLRKAQGNNGLQSFIKNIADELFADVVIEVLEKMPRPSAQTGVRANGPTADFGVNATTTDVNMLRDALGHHLSHYKAALKAHHAAPEGSPEKAKFRQTADAHMEHLFPLMHLAAKASYHSRDGKNKFEIDYPNIPPWESNYTTLKRTEDGKKKHRVDKLLNTRSKNSGSISAHYKNMHFLEMPPHPGHYDPTTVNHKSGYPWEEVQIGKPADIDAGKAYLHIEDIPAKPDFTPHEFDAHPIRGIQDVSNDHISPSRLQQYNNDLVQWHAGNGPKDWINRMRALPPGDFMSRGKTKPKHVYEGIPLQPHPEHVHEHMRNNPPKTAAAAPVATSAQPTAPSNVVAPTIRSSTTQGPTSSPAVSATAVNPSIRPAVSPTVRPAAVQPTVRPAATQPTAGATQPAPKTQASPVAAPSPDTKLLQQLLDTVPPDLRDTLLSNPNFQKELLNLHLKGKK